MNKHPATLMGQAVGDSLGMPYEMHDPHTSSALKAWDGSFRSGETNTLCPDLKPGQWTDDTKMAKALAESLVKHVGYSPLHAARGYLDWYHSGDLRGIGTATNQAMRALNMGTTYLRSGVPQAEGNGTAMRVGPIGLVYRPSDAADFARMDATITHDSEEAREGSVAVATAVSLLKEPLDTVEDRTAMKASLLDEVTSYMKPCKTRVRMRGDLLMAMQATQRTDSPMDALTAVIQLGVGAHVVRTVPAAFFCFLITDNFKDAVELAVRAGGDCDTTAAIVGAMAGTFYGLDATTPYTAQLEGAAELFELDRMLQRWGRWLDNFPDEHDLEIARERLAKRNDG